MRALRKWIRFLFGFSRTETNGFLVLLPLLVLIVISEPLYSWWESRRKIEPDPRVQELDRLVAEWAHADSLRHVKTIEARFHNLPRAFPFDPNTATAEVLVELGFPERIARNIIAYRAKGGVFRVKRDLQKIYGLDTGLYRHVRAYIRLPDTVQRAVFKPFEPTPVRVPVAFDINAADSSQLIAIYGIGSRLSRRIIAYREKLGGFIVLDQLREVYGLDTATVKQLMRRSYIQPGYVPRKLNINLATDRELSAHPYISLGIARAIVAYRFQHGNFGVVEDICGLQIVKKEDADKIIPYLSVNP
jgi:competence protein ComEA